MSKINGINTAKHIRDIGCDAQIIFLTTSEEYVFESFELMKYEEIPVLGGIPDKAVF